MLTGALKDKIDKTSKNTEKFPLTKLSLPFSRLRFALIFDTIITEKKGTSSVCMLDILKQNRDHLYEIARKYNGEEVFVFGSCARKEETQKSDIDFLVKFNDKASLFDQIKMKLDFSDFLKRNVDVISLSALKETSFYNNVYPEMILLS